MAVLALAGAGSAIGASIGGTFLGMSASSIGWMVGSFLGNLLFAEKTHTYGPRLKGDRFTGSALGQVRPIVWGTCKVEGKIIWQTPYHEHEHTEDSGGKGGGSEYTSYTYTRSFAILLCEGQIEAVRRVWINGKLEFDWSENSNVAADMQSGTKVGGVKFYYGSTTQLADPTMESFDGVGNVPAYRGTSYMVFNEYDVTESNGACPIVEVEVVANASLATQSALGLFITDPYSWGGIGYVNEGVLYFQTETNNLSNPFNIIGIDLSNGNIVYKKTYPNIHPGPHNGSQSGSFSDDQINWYFLGTDLNAGPVPPFYETASVTYAAKLIDGSTALYAVRLLYNTDGSVTQVANAGGWRSNGTMEKFRFKRGVDQTYLYATSIDANPDNKRWVQRWDMPDNYASTRYDFIDGSYALRSYPADDGDVYVFNANDHKIYKFDFDLNLIESKSISLSINVPDAIAYDNGIIWFCENLGNTSGNGIVTAYNYDDMSLIGQVNNLSYGITIRIGDRTWSVYASGNSLAITIEGKLWTVSTNRITRQSATLSDIVANLHQRTGQTSSDYDVAALTDSVRGFLVSEQVSVRSCIESLQLGFLFDARDTGGKIQYVKRGGASLATLVADDLGAYETEPVAEWMLTRQQEEELPRTLTINYLDYNGSYEKSAQNATRQAVLAGDITTFQVPIVFTSNEAQEVVSKHMYEAWEARSKYKFTTNMEWAKLEPCDPVTVRGKKMRLMQRNDGINGIVEFEGVGYIPEIYTQIGIGSDASGYQEETLQARGPTEFEIMDIPPLRDSDYNVFAQYAAATGLLAGWPGGAIMRSDNGDNYSFIALISSSSIMGYATTVLGDWTGGNVPDEKNTVTVQLYGSGTLSSITYDQFINGEFPFLLGNELIYGRSATLVSAGVYTISGLLRGRVGTESYIASHATNERFVLLSESNIRKITPRDNDFNVQRFYKGVTSRNKISSAITKAYTYSGNNLKPLYPVHIGGGTSGIGTSWTIKWMRRTRYRGKWLDAVDAGQDETSYNFEVRIYNNPDTPTTVVRTITVSNATASGGFFSTAYSDMNQITDFGSYQVRIAVSIRQIGADRNSEWSDIMTLNSGANTNSILLMHMDGTDGSTSFPDVYGHTASAVDNAQIDTAQSKFGGASLLLDGAGDYVSLADNADFELGSGDFTLEAQVYLTGYATSNAGYFRSTIFAKDVSGSRSYTLQITGTASSYTALVFDGFSDNTNFTEISGSFTFSLNTWYHVAATRSGNNIYLFVDGTQINVGSTAFSRTMQDSTSALKIGANDFDGTFKFYHTGNLDEIRISRFARYLANFTPPTSAFTE